MKTYTISNFSGNRKTLKNYIETSSETYHFPCKFEVYDDQRILKEYYAEESNIMGCGVILIEWKYVIV